MKGSKQIVPVVEKIPAEIEAMAGGTTSQTAVGGMISKLSAAKIATRAGCGVFIAASGAEPAILSRLLEGKGPGTFFVPNGIPSKQRSVGSPIFSRPTGTIQINASAVPVIQKQGRSLLAVGVTGAIGKFEEGDIVNVAGPDGTVVARGAASFSQAETISIAGMRSDEVGALFPGKRRLEVVHRDDLAVL